MPDNIQLTHDDHENPNIRYPLRLLLDDMNHPLNVGSLFRLSDALGIEKLYLCGDTPAPPNSKINKTARSTEKHVPFESHEKAAKLVRQLKKQNTYIIALEITSSSVDISSPEFIEIFQQKKEFADSYCLLLGTENTGVSQQLLELADLSIHIRMCGNNSSMNVVSAASIACYEICRQLIPC